MKIKAFNEIVKGLDGARSTNKTQEVEALAQKLHAQGVTTTLLEAREKARSMVTTEDAVTKDTQEKKDEATTYNDPRHNPNYNQYKAAMIEEMRKRAVEGRASVQIQNEFQTPGYEKRNPNQVHARAVVGKPETPMREAPKVSTVPAAQKGQEESKPAPTSTPFAQSAPKIDLEQYDAEPEQKAQPKVEKKSNPRIDLGSVFNFGKK